MFFGIFYIIQCHFYFLQFERRMCTLSCIDLVSFIVPPETTKKLRSSANGLMAYIRNQDLLAAPFALLDSISVNFPGCSVSGVNNVANDRSLFRRPFFAK